MESIIKQLEDPGWWFTAIFVAIVISVFSSYIRDWISLGLSRVSTSIRQKRAKRTEHETKRINLLTSNPHLLISEQLRAIGLSVRAAVFTIMYVTFPLFGEFLLRSYDTSFGHELAHDSRATIGLTIVTLCVGLLGIKTTFEMSARSRIAWKARREYEKICTQDSATKP